MREHAMDSSHTKKMCGKESEKIQQFDSLVVGIDM